MGPFNLYIVFLSHIKFMISKVIILFLVATN